MGKFKEYNIKTGDKNKKLVLKYLEEVKDYINNNSLDFDLYYDIEERVFEKLSGLDKVSQLKVKQILNEIGEPEDIFEMEESKANSDFFVFFRNMKNNSVKALRKIFKTGFSLGNLVVLIKTIIVNLFKFVKKLVIKVYKASYETIIYVFKNFKKLVGLLFKLAKKIFKLIGSFIGYIILLVAILLLFLVPVFHSGVEIGSINYTNAVPVQLVVSYLFGVLAVAILGIYFVLKRYFLLHFLLFGVSVVLMLSFGFVGATKLYNNHLFVGKIENDFVLQSDKDYFEIKDEDVDLYGDLFGGKLLFDEYGLDIKKSKDENVNLKVVSTVLTKDEKKLEKIKGNLNGFYFAEVEGELSLKVDNRNMFKQVSDFTPIHRTLEIYIPEDKVVKVNLGNMYRYWYKWNCDGMTFSIINGEVTCVQKIEK